MVTSGRILLLARGQEGQQNQNQVFTYEEFVLAFGAAGKQRSIMRYMLQKKYASGWEDTGGCKYLSCKMDDGCARGVCVWRGEERRWRGGGSVGVFLLNKCIYC